MSGGGPFFDLFRKPTFGSILVDFWAHFWLPLAPLCSPLGSFWRPCGSSWGPLGRFWLPFGPFWHHFGGLGAQVGELFGDFGSILVPSVQCWWIFMFFWQNVGNRSCFLIKFYNLFIVFEAFFSFRQYWVQFSDLSDCFAACPFAAHPPWPGGGTIAAGNRDRCVKRDEKWAYPKGGLREGTGSHMDIGGGTPGGDTPQFPADLRPTCWSYAWYLR